MECLREWFRLFLVLHLQVTILGIAEQKTRLEEKDMFNWNRAIISDYTMPQNIPSKASKTFTKTEKKYSRKERSEQSFSLQLQSEKNCRKEGSQPCTCLYPDHPNTTHFEFGTDGVTFEAPGSNGSRPVNCQDLIDIGYKLNGFYMVRLNTQRIQTVFCKFTNYSKLKIFDPALKESFEFSSQVKRLRFCGGFSNMSCNFFYSDHPDAPKFELNNSFTKNKSIEENHALEKNEPKNCEDLKVLGHTLKNFYVVRFSSKRMKAIYCDFSETNQTKNYESYQPANNCKNLGSQPCSCYLKDRGDIPQLEIGTDPETQNALALNGLGPSNCKDLQQLGHILKGFYLVRLNKKLMKIIYCEFKFQALDPNRATEEKIFNMSTIKFSDEEKFDKIVTNMSITITKKNNVPIKEDSKKQDIRPNEDLVQYISTIKPTMKGGFYSATSTTTKKPDQFGVYIYTANTTQGSKKYMEISLEHVDEIKFGDSYYLMNNHGKCLLPETFHFHQRTGEKLIQNVCNTFSGWDSGHQWSLLRGDKYGGGIRLSFSLYCVSFGGYLKGTSKYALFYGRDKGACGNEKWEALVLENGIQFVSGNHCLAIEGDSAENGRFAMSAVCDSEQKGQMWSFIEFDE